MGAAGDLLSHEEVRRRAWTGYLKWLAVGATSTAALYLAVPVAGYFLWVATSAFFGIRDEPDYILGVVSVTAAVAPFAAGAFTYRANRASRSRRRGLMRAAIACAGVAVICTLFAVILMGPF